MICSECGKKCEVIGVDFGIGPYEYWGECCTHVDIRAVSDCCEADCREAETETEDE